MSKKKTESEREDEIFIANVKAMMKTKPGKDFVWDLLGECRLNSESFTGNSTTFHNEGKRAIGLYILSLLEQADPTIYPRLILEKFEKKEATNE